MYRCFDELDDAIVILDRDNTVAWLNRSFKEIFGVETEAARGMDAGNFVTRHLALRFEDEGSAGRLLEGFRCQKEVSYAACRMRTCAGDLRWFSFSCRAMAGEPYAGMTLVRFQDVTHERDEAVRRAWESREEIMVETIFSGLGEMLPYGIWICEPDGVALRTSSFGGRLSARSSGTSSSWPSSATISASPCR